MSWACSNLKIARPRELFDGNDDLVLTIITSGNARASQRGRDIELGTGQAVLESSAEGATWWSRSRRAVSSVSGSRARRWHCWSAIPRTC
ncbi:hypothetical protein [Bradyrhizobium sp. 33ap4]|uniref:hypothetical protein n=1 Tax=Bradyrhizobium sp. 33ap4 TaxID=3061630 RepID=UPI003977B6B2